MQTNRQRREERAPRNQDRQMKRAARAHEQNRSRAHELNDRHHGAERTRESSRFDRLRLGHHGEEAARPLRANGLRIDAQGAGEEPLLE